MKPVILNIEQWTKIHSEIKDRYPPSVTLSREKMRKVLGFTPREHTEWVEEAKNLSRCRTVIYIDFFNEQQRTMFLLKYSDQLREEIEYS
jgi:hypothetical protein